MPIDDSVTVAPLLGPFTNSLSPPPTPTLRPAGNELSEELATIRPSIEPALFPLTICIGPPNRLTSKPPGNAFTDELVSVEPAVEPALPGFTT